MLKYTNHILLVGEGAKKFALSYGFKEEDLLTPESREAWLRWRANRGPERRLGQRAAGHQRR